MMNIICNLAGVVIVTLFTAGLAQSIWKSTHSMAFPIITAIVLLMIFKDFWDNIKEGK